MALTLYKYLQHQYAKRFVVNGEVLFRSLSFFLACEHDERGDDLEGTRTYEPATGLEITKQTGEKLGWQGSFRSSVKEPDKLFIFSTSTLLSADLALKFQDDACVEIADVGKFVDRLRTALRRKPRAKVETLIHGPVTYYRTENPPEEVWALPERIVMHKPERFADQCEYRFAFSTRADAFEFENVNVTLVRGQPARHLPGSYPEDMLLKLGLMSDCCRIHRF
ncbi:MAG: hypothetical protein ABIH23_31310 [bacterium]